MEQPLNDALPSSHGNGSLYENALVANPAHLTLVQSGGGDERTLADHVFRMQQEPSRDTKPSWPERNLRTPTAPKLFDVVRHRRKGRARRCGHFQRDRANSLLQSCSYLGRSGSRRKSEDRNDIFSQATDICFQLANRKYH